MTHHFYVLIVSIVLLFNPVGYGQKHLSDQDLWKHVVTIDRLVWDASQNEKKVNTIISEIDFVRRLYIDIEGRIPSYEEIQSYLGDKTVNKRSHLITELLNSKGYVANYSVFFQKLLRTHQTRTSWFKRYLERVLYENRPYDKIVFEMLTAVGHENENQAIGYWAPDRVTGPMETFSATTQAFLGTRLQCAQCHNHRFDKWTQKEFYESAAYFHGTKFGLTYNGGPLPGQLNKHSKVVMDSFKRKSAYVRRVLFPASPYIKEDDRSSLKYPDSYIYPNAKPGSDVKPRIIFDYGDENVEGSKRREVFANWLTSKNNKQFARIMANRLWKKAIGFANLEPMDDYKDNIEITNEKLFNTLGEIFIELNYDMKALLSVIFNSQAYQYKFDLKNQIKKSEDYKGQAMPLRRMTYNQIYDSLLFLRHGRIIDELKLDSQYFEFEDRINELAAEYKPKINKILLAHVRTFSDAKDVTINDEAIELMKAYAEKVFEAEDYFNISEKGYLKNASIVETGKQKLNPSKQDSNSMAMMNGSMPHNPQKIKRAHLKEDDFMMTFGRNERTVGTTDYANEATMKQILTMMNSNVVSDVGGKTSYLMNKAYKMEDFKNRIQFLYYSIYGRKADSYEIKLADQYIENKSNQKLWQNYVIALLNSPEFYFIK